MNLRPLSVSLGIACGLLLFAKACRSGGIGQAPATDSGAGTVACTANTTKLLSRTGTPPAASTAVKKASTRALRAALPVMVLRSASSLVNRCSVDAGGAGAQLFASGVALSLGGEVSARFASPLSPGGLESLATMSGADASRAKPVSGPGPASSCPSPSLQAAQHRPITRRKARQRAMG